jgi:pimeloyl-ACP methyl ester carboxylesterase
MADGAEEIRRKGLDKSTLHPNLCLPSCCRVWLIEMARKVLLSLAAILVCIGVYYYVYDSILDDDIEELEEHVIKKLYNSTITSQWINVTVPGVNGPEIWPTHLLHSSEIHPNKPNLVLLHGYGATSALTWRVTIPGLIERFNIYAIDMPGFGRSPAPLSLLSLDDPHEAHLEYCSYYRHTLDTLNLTDSPPFLIAHSFGGFVITHCLAQYPQLVSGLLLVAVPGFFPTNGPWGYLCASYFSLGLPQLPIQLLGDWTHLLYELLQYLHGVKIDYVFVRYWHLVHMSRHLLSDVIVRKFITHRGLYSLGVGVSFLPLLKITHGPEGVVTSSPLPVAIVFGGQDFISPPQQGVLSLSLSFS